MLLLLLWGAVISAMNSETKLIGRIPKPLPSPLRSNIPGTWAHSTMSKRIIDDIWNRIVEDNTDELTQPTSKLRSECFLVLNDLKSSLECGTSGYLRGIYDDGLDKKVCTCNEDIITHYSIFSKNSTAKFNFSM